MSNGGGSAINTGIDYQQRLATYFLVQMLLDINTLSGIGLDGVYSITDVSFESSSCIDDIVIKTKNGDLYIQAKRNISMSDNLDSEFQKTINQFVNQFLLSSSANDKYILATSSGSSLKIKNDLRKILESVRLNDTAFMNNPLNQSEKEVYNKLKNCISAAYKNSTNNEITDSILINLLKQIYVIITDVQQGMPLEGALLTVLANRSKVKAELFLSSLISLALSLASNRQSINKNGLESKMGNYLGPITPEKKAAIEQDFLHIEFDTREIPSGWEVLIVESIRDDFDFMIVELYRFNDAGNKRMQFYGDICKTPNDIEWKVIYRAATSAAIVRFIEERADFFKDKKVAVLQSSKDDGSTNAFCLSYQDLCRNILKNNKQILRCLHCGDFISEDGTPLIEIDEVGVEQKLGLIHNSCLRPLDRVIGLLKAQLFEEYAYLKDFDYKSWFALVQDGQAFFVSLQGKLNQMLFVAWNPDGYTEFKGNYCVKINLDDGSSRYVHHRNLVVRQAFSSATESAQFFNLGFEEARLKNDPSCYTSKNNIFGAYSVCMRMKDEDEECLECTNAEVASYTLAIEKAYNRFSNYYAPVIMLLDKESGQPIIVGNTIFIIDNPLRLNAYLANWSKAGIVMPDYKVEIIKSDHEFDISFYKFLKNGFQVVANPLFDRNQIPLSGIVFRPIEALETIRE